MKTTFFSMVMNHFQYLVTTYGFTIKKVDESERARDIEGRIEFENPTTFVTVSSEQWTVGAIVGRAKDDKYRFFIDPATIHEYTVLTESDKKVLCSFDPKEEKKARALIHQTRLLHSKSNTDSAIEDINGRLADYSRWLRQFAEPFLRGDFSKWLEIYEYKVNRTRAAYIRSGKNELVRTVGQNKDARISIFQNSLNYLEKLREEYGRE